MDEDVSKKAWRSIAVPLVVASLLLPATGCGDEAPSGPVPTGEPPVAGIAAPLPGSVHLAGEIVAFVGTAEDAEDGVLGGEALVWRSDVDGRLGTGGSLGRDDLSIGSHRLTLTATDSDGRQDSASVNLVVEPAPTGEPLSVLPADWRMPVDDRLRFRLGDGTGPDVRWFVEGVEGGNEAVGTIGEDGLYVAPARVPPLGSVRVRAVWEGGDGVRRAGTSPVDLISEPEPIDVRWTLWTPRVVSADREDPLTWQVAVSGNPAAVRMDRPGSGTIDLAPIRTGRWGLEIGPDEVIDVYETGDLHAFVGFLEIFDADARLFRGNVFVNVKDATVPDVVPEPLDDEAQATSHVVNIRWPDRLEDRSFPAAISRRFYELVPDDFDFLAVVEPQNFFANRSYWAVRNDVEGIGATIFDRTAEHGSEGRLQGRIRYPLSFFFDLAETSGPHEIGHRWMAFLDNPELEGSGAHWPVSSLARGVMGYSGAGGQGSPFPYRVVHVDDDVYELQCVEPKRDFNDLELYLMGLLPPEDVGEHVVFDPEPTLECGAHGTGVSLTIEDVIAVNGERVPPAGEAQTDFRLATIVLSHGRLLSADEISFFHHMAERGEAREELPFTSGFSAGTTKPFYVATGGRATLTTRIRP